MNRFSSCFWASAIATLAPVKSSRCMSVTTDCCATLEAVGLARVLYPSSVEYTTRDESYFSVSAQLGPDCIVQPKSAEEVALAVTTLTHDTSCNFAIRGGGHTVWPGASNIDNGVTIDLGLMNKTTYVEDSSTARIQAGSRWREVYASLEPYGVTVPGGRTSTVGVAGFLTGGGNTFYTGRHGLGCDNVDNFEVVLASGKIINANVNDNSDLFKALKGGSSNFGIVTRFDMQAFKAPKLWGGLVTYSTSTTDQHIAAYVDWVENVENYMDGSAVTFWTYMPEAREIRILSAYEDTTGAVAAPAFDKFMTIPDVITSTMRIDSHLNLTIELDLVDGYRNVWFALTFKNDPRLYKRAVEMHKEFVASWQNETGDSDFICHAIFQAIPTIFSKHSVEKGGNVLGLDRETDHAVMFQFQFAFHDEFREPTARERVTGFREALKQYSVDLDAAVDWEYLNYADYTQDPLSTYGEENVAFMREVAAKYDPIAVYQTRMPGGFKISHVG